MFIFIFSVWKIAASLFHLPGCLKERNCAAAAAISNVLVGGYEDKLLLDFQYDFGYEFMRSTMKYANAVPLEGTIA